MKEIFVGWAARPPAHLRAFLRRLALGLPLMLLGLGLILGLAPQDPAGPRFATGGAPLPSLPMPEPGVTGVLTLRPYPLLHVGEGGGMRTLLLAGDGKQRPPGDLSVLDGQRVTAEGFLLSRGDIAMLVLGAPPRALGGATPPAREALGRWRITGEICDGKCAADGMRPGIGIAHRACAALCLDGGIPAVFVSQAPLLGHAYLLLAGPDGGPMDAALRPLIGRRVTLEGRVERLGRLLIFHAEPPG
ncbi:hypothetical protein KTR66_16665 [Roseococcus sp. SDR]|uniref:hypothetical protein n=1 Tax=Roseococcus sp. SDR TaxID=2835532 RepID=UPI001BD18C93|nr:hypothetical protein [Roseococcus sp. SDR]MBS7791638.1 hypothetical protein [Roseococcus sp. SDR]MBV1846952.1 hypothetical protein [Roseococcus sp. SDR]